MSRSLKRAFTLIGVFFAVLFVAIGATLSLTFAAFEPPMDDSYYRRGLEYQQQLQKLADGRQSGWKLVLFNISRDKPVVVGPVPVELHLIGGGPYDGVVEMDLRLERPASTRGRQLLRFRGQRSGSKFVFKGMLQVSAPGAWELFAVAGAPSFAVEDSYRFDAVAAPQHGGK